MSKDYLEKLQDKLVELESFFPRIEDGLFYKEELQEILQKFEKEILLFFAEDSDDYRIWKNCMNNRAIWKISPKSGAGRKLAGEDEVKEINRKIDCIKKILERNSQTVLEREKVFSPQQQYSAKRYILNILKSAKESIVIIDEYLKSAIFDLLDEIDEKVEIELLTGKSSATFQSVLRSVETKKISAKKLKWSNSSHSRYIIIDGKIYFHLGHSISAIDGGIMKGFSIQKIVNENAIEALNKDIDTWKNEAEEII